MQKSYILRKSYSPPLNMQHPGKHYKKAQAGDNNSQLAISWQLQAANNGFILQVKLHARSYKVLFNHSSPLFPFAIWQNHSFTSRSASLPGSGSSSGFFTLDSRTSAALKAAMSLQAHSHRHSIQVMWTRDVQFDCQFMGRMDLEVTTLSKSF